MKFVLAHKIWSVRLSIFPRKTVSTHRNSCTFVGTKIREIRWSILYAAGAIGLGLYHTECEPCQYEHICHTPVLALQHSFKEMYAYAYAIAGLSNQSSFVLHTLVSHRPYVIEYRIVSSGTESCVCEDSCHV